MQPLHHLRNGPVGVALPVVQAVGAALGGACVVQWRVSSTEQPPAFSGQMGRLSIKPELATRRDSQTTHRPLGSGIIVEDGHHFRTLDYVP
jgi:hypothetical protein